MVIKHTLLLKSEVAEILGCSCEKVVRLCRSRKLAYLPGRRILIDRADLDAFLETEKQRRVAQEEAKRGIKPTPTYLARMLYVRRKMYERAKDDAKGLTSTAASKPR